MRCKPYNISPLQASRFTWLKIVLDFVQRWRMLEFVT